MRYGKILLTGGTSLAAAAAFNALASRVRPLENLLGGEEGWFEWRRHRVAYTRRGQGTPLLLVHGIYAGAWSYEWRHNVDRLAERHTVYTIDLLGFGRSDRPGIKYTAPIYQQLVADFAQRVVRAPCVLVASSLSAAHAVALAARDAATFPALVLSVPTGIAQLRADPSLAGEGLRLLVESPLLGTTLYNSLVTRAGIRHFLEPLYAQRSLVTPELVDVYHQASHQPGAKHALAAFVSGQLNTDIRQPLRRLTQRTLVVWGRRAKQTPVDEAHVFRVLKPDADLVVLDHAGDLPHDERADVFNEMVIEFARLREAGPRVIPIRKERAG